MKNRADIESVDNKSPERREKARSGLRKLSVLASGQQTGYGCGRSAVDMP